MNIMTMLNIRKLSFQISAFSNINMADAHSFDSVVASIIYISFTILCNNVAWKNMQYFSGQYFG
jgi:uncharacterized membrane protein